MRRIVRSSPTHIGWLLREIRDDVRIWNAIGIAILALVAGLLYFDEKDTVIYEWGVPSFIPPSLAIFEEMRLSLFWNSQMPPAEALAIAIEAMCCDDSR